MDHLSSFRTLCIRDNPPSQFFHSNSTSAALKWNDICRVTFPNLPTNQKKVTNRSRIVTKVLQDLKLHDLRFFVDQICNRNRKDSRVHIQFSIHSLLHLPPQWKILPVWLLEHKLKMLPNISGRNFQVMLCTTAYYSKLREQHTCGGSSRNKKIFYIFSTPEILILLTNRMHWTWNVVCVGKIVIRFTKEEDPEPLWYTRSRQRYFNQR